MCFEVLIFVQTRVNTLSSSIYIVPVVILTIAWNITRFNELTTCYTTVPVMIIHMVLFIMVMVMMPIVIVILQKAGEITHLREIHHNQNNRIRFSCRFFSKAIN